MNKEEQDYFECKPVLDPGLGVWQAYMQERGNMKGVSIPNVNQWVKDIIKNGKATQHDSVARKREPKRDCLLKLYDNKINAFKLNEQVSFIGVLEFKMPTDNEKETVEDNLPNTTNFDKET